MSYVIGGIAVAFLVLAFVASQFWSTILLLVVLFAFRGVIRDVVQNFTRPR